MGCGCIGKVSLVAKPAKESDCYFGCDAKGHTGSGAKCPEFTLFEGNKYGFKTTPHTCNEPTARGLFQQCDSKGDLSIDSYEFENGFSYGPGKDLDTKDSMFIMVNFNAEEDQLVSYDVSITSLATNKTYKVTREGAYLAGLSKYLKQGMVLQIS